LCLRVNPRLVLNCIACHARLQKFKYQSARKPTRTFILDGHHIQDCATKKSRADLFKASAKHRQHSFFISRRLTPLGFEVRCFHFDSRGNGSQLWTPGGISPRLEGVDASIYPYYIRHTVPRTRHISDLTNTPWNSRYVVCS
jgi:hypothetical protein